MGEGIGETSRYKTAAQGKGGRLSRKISLINSDQKAIVDNIDFKGISKHQWRLSEDGYAVTEINGVTVEMGMLVLCPWIAEQSPQTN
jgi:hypothetical protein